MFKATISSQFRRSKSPSLFSLGVQSHHLFSVSTFKATISSQFLRSKSPSLFSLGVQSHHLFSVWRSEPQSFLSYSIQSHHIFSVTTFRVVIHSLAFRAIISSQFRRLKPTSLLILVFKAASSVWHLEPHFHFFVQSCNSILTFGASS